MLDPNKDIFLAKEEDQELLDYLKYYHYNAEALNFCLEKGGNLDGYDLTKLLNTHLRAGDTILYDSITQNHPHGYPKVTKFLLEKGADPNLALASSTLTPIHIATFLNNFKITELLINHGANVNSQSDRGKYTPLHNALSQNKIDLSLVKLLLEKGADINIKNRDGNTPLEFMKSKNIDVNTLLDDGHITDNKETLNQDKPAPYKNFDFYKLNQQEADLVHAIQRGDISSISNALNKGVVLKDHDISEIINQSTGTTPLINAIYDDNIQVARYLLNKGADSNLADYHGIYPLHCATYCQQEEMMDLLITYKADVNKQDDRGQTPIFKLLTSTNKINPALIKYLIEKGADISVKDKNNTSPLDLMIAKNIHIEGLIAQPHDDSSTDIATNYLLEETDNNTIPMLGESEPTVKEL